MQDLGLAPRPHENVTRSEDLGCCRANRLRGIRQKGSTPLTQGTGRLRTAFRTAPSQLDPSKVDVLQYQGAESVVTVPINAIRLRGAAFCKSSNEAGGVGDLVEPYCQGDRIVEVKLPDGLEEIGNRCFAGCSNLRSIQLPNTVRRIGRNAFQSSGLENVTMRANVQYGILVHAMNRSMKTLYVEPGVETIPRGCFWLCSELEDVDLPGTLKEIGKSAFFWMQEAARDCDS